jgi:hypothetical protein
MALIAPQTTDFEFTPAPTGTHIARCIGIVDMGLQKVTFNNEVSWKHKVRFTFELPNCLMTDGEMAGQPFTVSNNYTFSLHKRSMLRRDIEGWANKKLTEETVATLDILKFLGRVCTLNIIHNESGDRLYANIASISPKMDGMTCPPAVNPLTSFEISNHTPEQFAALPEWLRNKINIEAPPTQPAQATPHAVYQHQAASPVASPAPAQAQTQGTQGQPQPVTQAPANNFDDFDDDIPF